MTLTRVDDIFGKHTVESYTRQALTATGTTTWRVTETDTSYDATLTEADVGLPTATYSHTVPADPTYDRCHLTGYAPPNTGANLVGLTGDDTTYSTACAHFTEGPGPASTRWRFRCRALRGPISLLTPP